MNILENIHVTWPVIIWLLIGLLALSINIWGAVDSYLDKELVKNNEDSGLKIAAERSFSREIIRVISQILFLIGGFAAIFIQPAPNHVISFPETLFQIVFILAQVLIALNGILDRRARHKITEQ